MEFVKGVSSLFHLLASSLLVFCFRLVKFLFLIFLSNYRQRRKTGIGPTPCVTVSNLIPWTI